MTKRLLLTIGTLVVLLALPALASATVAFTKITAPYTTASQPKNPAIYVAKNDGTAAHKLAVTGKFPTISPNGKIVAYLVSVHSGGAMVGQGTLRFVTIKTGAVVNTKTNCDQPYWAPNSSAVACDTNIPNQGFRLITVKTKGTTTTIAPADTNDYFINLRTATWSPDSSTLAWSEATQTQESSSSQSVLRSMKADGTGPVLNLGNGNTPAWGPTGLIAFTDDLGQAWTEESNGSTPKVLTNFRSGKEINPYSVLTWAPNGKTILGAVNIFTDTRGVANSITIDAKSGSVKPLGSSNLASKYSNMVEAVSSDSASALLLYQPTLSGKNAVGYLRTVSLSTGKSKAFMNNVASISVSADWKP